MDYKNISYIKTYFGVGTIYFYYFPNNYIQINSLLFSIGILCYSWYLIEEFFLRSEKTRKISIASDLIIDIIVIIFLVKKITTIPLTFNYPNFYSYSTNYLIIISMIIFIIHLTKISKLSDS